VGGDRGALPPRQGVATALCLLMAYPVAYFVARYAGRRKVFYLLLLVAPFWISYMMRMLAWVNLLSTDGLLNRGLVGTGLIGGPVNWLDGRASTVVLGLTYGYVATTSPTTCSPAHRAPRWWAT
jgi:ABC-type spermidine/putrescine transport system permease subunit I